MNNYKSILLIILCITVPLTSFSEHPAQEQTKCHKAIQIGKIIAGTFISGLTLMSFIKPSRGFFRRAILVDRPDLNDEEIDLLYETTYHNTRLQKIVYLAFIVAGYMLCYDGFKKLSNNKKQKNHKKATEKSVTL